MMDWNDESDRASVEKIVNRLQAPVKLDETFDVRVMSAVHSAALAQVDARHVAQSVTTETAAPWWRKQYTFSVSALGGLAMAASIVGIIVIGANQMSRTVASAGQTREAALAATRPADVRNVSFILVTDDAKQVWLVGDFNGWTRKETPLTRSVNGSAWTVSLPLTSGRHEYAFIVADANGEHWVADPLTPQVEDDFGTTSSIVRVEATS